MSGRIKRDIPRVLRLLDTRFFARKDKVAILAPWGKPCPAEVLGEFKFLLGGHILGRRGSLGYVRYTTRQGTKEETGFYRVGTYAPALDGTTPWICVDLDGEGHAAALADPTGVALRIQRTFTEAGLPVHLEKSGGGHGWHVWCFFERPIQASVARRLAFALLPKDVLLADGGIANPEKGQGIEVFPKQDRVNGNGVGNSVWLPWWAGAPEGANEFYRVTDEGELESYEPEELETATEEMIENALPAQASLPEEEQEVEGGAVLCPSTNMEWREWRETALASLPLEQIYSEFLTGKVTGDGWLECRDPESKTGDRHPSAGVADTTPKAERGSFHSFLSGETRSVFDFLMDRGVATDLRDAFRIVSKLSNIRLPSPSGNGTGPHEKRKREEKPSIQMNARQLIDVVNEAWSALLAANAGPTYFMRSGHVVQLSQGESGVTLGELDETTMFGVLARVSEWHRAVGDGRVVSASPPKDVARDMLAFPHEDLPRLESVVVAPVFSAAGNVIRRRGYHRREALWYEPPEGFRVGKVSSEPTLAEIEEAKALLLEEALIDFPFAADSDKAHALAALILPFARRLIDDCVPIHLIEAPSPGSGKGLLADVVSLVAEGRPCQVTTISRDEGETRKKLTSILLQGRRVVLIDNVRDSLDSEQLAAALTAQIWSDRILGQTRMVDLPNRATWMATANNPQLSLELARRCARVRLDPKVDKPWEREGFRHDPLRGWVSENRGRLVHAVLTIIQGWIAAGKPRGIKTLGSFEQWAYTIGGILDVAGVPGFLESQGELYEQADAEGQEWREFATRWWSEHGDGWVRVKDLMVIAEREDLLPLTRGSKGDRSQRIRVGRKLSQMRDRRLGNHRIQAKNDDVSNATQYRLQEVETAKPIVEQ